MCFLCHSRSLIIFSLSFFFLRINNLKLCMRWLHVFQTVLLDSNILYHYCNIIQCFILFTELTPKIRDCFFLSWNFECELCLFFPPMSSNWRVISFSAELQVIVFTVLLRSLISRIEVNYNGRKTKAFSFFPQQKSSINIYQHCKIFRSRSSLVQVATLESCYSPETCLYQESA